MRKSLAILCLLPLPSLLAADEPTEGPKPAVQRAAGRCSHPGSLVLHSYAVADLLVPESLPTIIQGGSFGWKIDRRQRPEHSLPKKASPSARAATAEEAAALVKLIQGAVAPVTWHTQGGQGTIDYFAKGLTLVIRQTPDVHEEIADLLAALRRTQDIEVAFEVRLVRVSLGVFNDLLRKPDLHAEAEKAVNGSPAMKKASVFLDTEQLRNLLEAVQGDAQSHVVQTPKITVFNGQCARLDMTTKHRFVTALEPVREEGQLAVVPKNEAISTGVTLALRPAVSEDRRFVLVKFTGHFASLDAVIPAVAVATHLNGGPGKDGLRPDVPVTQHVQEPRLQTMTLDNCLRIPDGKTAVVALATKSADAQAGHGQAVLSKIPHVNRLFKNVSFNPEPQITLVLITPRIIVEQEEEEKMPGKAKP